MARRAPHYYTHTLRFFPSLLRFFHQTLQRRDLCFLTLQNRLGNGSGLFVDLRIGRAHFVQIGRLQKEFVLVGRIAFQKQFRILLVQNGTWILRLDKARTALQPISDSQARLCVMHTHTWMFK